MWTSICNPDPDPNHQAIEAGPRLAAKFVGRLMAFDKFQRRVAMQIKLSSLIRDLAGNE